MLPCERKDQVNGVTVGGTVTDFGNILSKSINSLTVHYIMFPLHVKAHCTDKILKLHSKFCNKLFFRSFQIWIKIKRILHYVIYILFILYRLGYIISITPSKITMF